MLPQNKAFLRPQSQAFKEKKCRQTQHFLCFSMKCFIMPVIREQGSNSNIIYDNLYFACFLKKLLCVLVSQHQFQLEEEGWIKLRTNNVSSLRRNVFENINHLYNLSPSKKQNTCCVAVFVFVSLKIKFSLRLLATSSWTLLAKVEEAASFSSLVWASQWHRASQLLPITLSDL